MKKILEINFLKNKIEFLKKQKKKIVLCHGVFDLIHLGHIKYFEEAKKNGDILIVSITENKHVRKGVNRPYFNSQQRAQVISSLKIVDFVLINDDETSVNVIQKLKPNFYVKGPDYKNKKLDITKNIYKEIKAAKNVGSKIIYTKTEIYSSTKLLNNFFAKEEELQNKFINKVKKNTNSENIFQHLDNLKNKNILLIGDAIIDEYIFADALNKSGKDTILTFNVLNKEKYLGGVFAVGNNIASFCKKVYIITTIGDSLEEYRFIKKNLKKNVVLNFYKKKQSNTIKKSRLINKYDNQKQIGLYYLDDFGLDSREENILVKKIKQNRNKINSIIVSDFGHGIITDKIFKTLKNLKKTISVNSQINSSNIGFHSLNKFKKADYLTLNFFELKHETRDHKSDIKELAKKLCHKLRLKKIFVTNGHQGSILYDMRKKAIVSAPGFTQIIKDRIGSGDSYFAFVSLASFVNASNIETIFLASLSSYFNLQDYANKSSIDPVVFKKTILYSLK